MVGFSRLVRDEAGKPVRLSLLLAFLAAKC